MAAKPSGRPARLMMADAEPEERRGWLSGGLTALGVSALGLLVAGSLSLTTSAEPMAVPAVPNTVQPNTVQPSTVQPSTATVPTNPTVVPAPQSPSQVTATGTLQAFAPRAAAADAPSRSELRAAIARERTAQRAETLSKAAAEVSQAARDDASAARNQDLATTDRATRENAVKIAQERLRAAVAARLAAESDRQQTESGAQSTLPTDPNTTLDVPTGGGSASPVPGAVIGAHFGQYGLWSRYHTGLDFRASYGTPIRAVTNGVVLFAGNSGDWAGNHVAIRHAGGYTSMSSHMSSMAVRAGQTVSAGQVIGYVGQTGRAFGAHLHFEIYPPGVRYGDVYSAINPQPWLARQGVATR